MIRILRLLLLFAVLCCVTITANATAITGGTHLIFQVQSTATASQVNGGGFDPANTHFLTDGAATSGSSATPGFSSASYNFVANDANEWIYIQAGSGWNIGGTSGLGCYYKITSVASNVAILDAAIGDGVCVNSSGVWKATTVNGVGGTTGATWGEDLSQRDTAYTSDSVMTGATTSATDATNPFDTHLVGNIINMASGTGVTAGWYEIISVSGVTATLDRSAGTTYSAVVNKVGGAFDNITTADTSLWAASPVNAKMFVKGGSSITYTPGGAVTPTSNGSIASGFITLEGYNAIRGDRPVNSNRPTIIMAGNLFTAGLDWMVRNLQFTCNTCTAPIRDNNSGGLMLVEDKFTNTGTGGLYAIELPGATSNNGADMVYSCEAISYSGTAINLNGTGGVSVINSYAHDSSIGIDITGNSGGPGTITGNIVASNYTAGINGSTQTGATIIGNTIYGAENKLGTCVKLNSGSPNITLISNNIFYGCSTGITFNAGRVANYINYNDFYNNTTDRTNANAGPNDIALNPTFTSVTQVTGTTAKTLSGNRLQDTTQNFTTAGVAVGQYIYISAGTGVTTGVYGITAITTVTNPNDTLTVDNTLTANATTDKVYQIRTNSNFAIGTNLKAQGYPGAFAGGLSTGYMDIGAVQRQESGGAAGGTCTFGENGNWPSLDAAVNDNQPFQYRKAI